MRFEYGLIGVMAALVLGILGMIALGPEEIAVPKPELEAGRETIAPMPAPGFEDVPEMIVEEEPIEEPIPSMPPPESDEIQDIGIQEEIEVEITPEEPPPLEPELPLTAIVDIAEGSGVPGCEETNACYIPYQVSIAVGGKVTWNNPDTAAHTVTSGNPADGPDGVFDSSLFMSGNSFSHTFDNSGTFEYFCMVHPWMIGVVQVS